MPLISPEKSKDRKIQLRLRFPENLLKEVEAYCVWVGIRKKDYFIEHAIRYILQHDKKWKSFEREQHECEPK
jgi:hypothetical protein